MRMEKHINIKNKEMIEMLEWHKDENGKWFAYKDVFEGDEQ